jgi:hypothetical protein
MRFTRTFLTVGLAAAITACAGGPQPEPENNPLLDISAYDPDGGERCLSLTRIRSTKVLNAQVIEFKMTGGKTYLNILPNKCIGLRPNQPFMYRTSQSSLCDLDLITVLDQFGGGLRPMGACGLGRFYLVPETGVGPVLEDDEDVSPP